MRKRVAFVYTSTDILVVSSTNEIQAHWRVIIHQVSLHCDDAINSLKRRGGKLRRRLGSDPG